MIFWSPMTISKSWLHINVMIPLTTLKLCSLITNSIKLNITILISPSQYQSLTPSDSILKSPNPNTDGITQTVSYFWSCWHFNIHVSSTDSMKVFIPLTIYKVLIQLMTDSKTWPADRINISDPIDSTCTKYLIKVTAWSNSLSLYYVLFPLTV